MNRLQEVASVGQCELEPLIDAPRGAPPLEQVRSMVTNPKFAVLFQADKMAQAHAVFASKRAEFEAALV